jgi:hypothetical protein
MGRAEWQHALQQIYVYQQRRQVKQKAHLHENLVPIGRIHKDPMRLDPLLATLVALV